MPVGTDSLRTWLRAFLALDHLLPSPSNLMLPEQSSTMAIEPVPLPNWRMISSLARTATLARGGSGAPGRWRRRRARPGGRPRSGARRPGLGRNRRYSGRRAGRRGWPGACSKPLARRLGDAAVGLLSRNSALACAAGRRAVAGHRSQRAVSDPLTSGRMTGMPGDRDHLRHRSRRRRGTRRRPRARWSRPGGPRAF